MKTIIETKRLLLREFSEKDGPLFFEMNNHPEVLQFTGDKPFQTQSEAKQFLLDYSHYQDYGYGRWTVVLKETGKAIGWCGLKYHDEGYIDIGYRFLRSEWGRGYATEAAKACLSYGKDELLLSPIWGRVAPENKASIRVLEKLGMEFFKKDACNGIEGALYYRLPS